MNRSLRLAAVIGVLVLQRAPSFAAVSVTGTVVTPHERTGLTIISGRVALPAEGLWTLLPSAPDGEAAVRQVQLTPPGAIVEAMHGRRGAAIQRQRAKMSVRRTMHRIYHPLRRFAVEHDGRMPLSLSELENSEEEAVRKALNQPPEPLAASIAWPAPPHYAVVTNAVLLFKELDSTYHYRYPTNDVPIVIELHPLVDDGKHRVLSSRNRWRREPIDASLIKRLGVTVEPVLPRRAVPTDTANYTLAGLLQRLGQKTMLTLTNRHTHASAVCVWEVPDEPTVQAAPDVVLQWATGRAAAWLRLAGATDAPGLQTWLYLQKDMFGISLSDLGAGQRRHSREQDRQTDVFNMFGGRAAMRETLQLQALRATDADSGTPPIAVTSIKGVEVTSHPFKAMVADRAGGSLPLADRVPHDRFLVYVSQPDALLPLLDKGGEFLGSVGAGATGRALFYDLKARYTARLGVTERFVRALVTQGLYQDMALFVPDLFFIDGTDLTVMVRVRHAEHVTRLLGLAGMTVTEGAVTPVATASGRIAYWAVAGDVVMASTSRRELAAALELGNRHGKDSLGRSDEFRYMLTCLPPTDTMRVYAYFSDAFIRRLVGPEVKIAQRRRLQVRAAMETTAYAALLHRHDGHGQAESMAALQASGYLPDAMAVDGINLKPDGTVASDIYGPMAAMRTLGDVPLSHATPAEAKAYETYRDRYSRYWRRFFDPIALRIDDVGDGTLVMTTYILPLLENAMYDSLRQVVSTDAPHALAVPDLTPAPVARLSLQISEEAWEKALSDIWQNMALGVGADVGMLDDIGPGFHFAVFDSEPVIAMGSRTMLGFGARLADSDELMIPLFVSLLTRPCALIVELQRTERVREFLHAGHLPRLLPGADRWMQPTYYRLNGKDAWIVGFDSFGIGLRFRIELRGHYLVLSNMPWRGGVDVTGVSIAAAAGGSLVLSPAQVDIEKDALYMSAMEGLRVNVQSSLAYRAPYSLMGLTPERAMEEHRRQFGFVPRLPGVMTVTAAGVPACDPFGSLRDPHQPDLGDGPERFGVLRDIRSVEASFQFEDTGLRTVIRWAMEDAKP